jgi:hypothetical protein
MMNVPEQVPWDVPARWYEMYPLARVALAPDRSPPLQVPPIAMTSIMADGWADDFSDWGQLRANGSVSGSYPYDNTSLPAYWQRRARQACE